MGVPPWLRKSPLSGMTITWIYLDFPSDPLAWFQVIIIEVYSVSSFSEASTADGDLSAWWWPLFCLLLLYGYYCHCFFSMCFFIPTYLYFDYDEMCFFFLTAAIHMNRNVLMRSWWWVCPHLSISLAYNDSTATLSIPKWPNWPRTPRLVQYGNSAILSPVICLYTKELVESIWNYVISNYMLFVYIYIFKS